MRQVGHLPRNILEPEGNNSRMGNGEHFFIYDGLQGVTDRISGAGRCQGVEMNVENPRQWESPGI